MAYTKYSLTPANNTAAPPDGAPEGMLPSAVNDTMRDMMAQIRDCGDGIRDGTYTMTAPKITGGTITGVTLTGNTFSSPVISGGSINNTPIGATTASTGVFTTSSLKGSTSGVITLDAVAVAGTNTATFPAATGTVMVSGNMPAFSAYLGTSQTVTTGVATKIQFNTEVFDTASAFDSTTNYRFQPLVAGYYQVNGMVYGSASTNLTALYCQINKTGTLYQYSSIFQVAAGVGAAPLASVINTIIYLNGSTDYIELFGTISGTGTCTFTTTTGTINYFNAVLVRAA